MITTLKVYAVSALVFSQLHPDAPAKGTYVEHFPAIIPAESIFEAAERAKEMAFARWPLDDGKGWYGHQASVGPADPGFYEAFAYALAAGAVDDIGTEAGQIFQFDV